jgi:hypothetical protein
MTKIGELNEHGHVYVGYRPAKQGYTKVYASSTLIAELGFERVQEELVDVHWRRAGLIPPGYYKVRTRPFNDDHVLIKANSQEEAIQKYLNSKNNLKRRIE